MMRKWAVVIVALLAVGSISAQTSQQKKATKKTTKSAATKKKTNRTSAQRRPVTDSVTVRAQRGQQSQRGLSAEVRVNSSFFGNFFQAPEGVPEEDVLAAGVEGRVAMPLPFEPNRQPVEGYLFLDYLQFDQEEFGGSPGVRVGARSEGRPHGWDGSAQLQMDRPAFDVGDQLDQADIARLSGDYSYRLGRDWQFGAGADFEKQSFDLAEQRDNDFIGLGASVRYRGFGSEFSPELGFALGNRSVDDETEDYGQTDWIFQIRSAPTPPLYLSARYRHRVRDYDTEVRTSSNFGREDTRDQIVLAADLRTGIRLTWNFYLGWEDADSTLASRTFDTLLAAFGITYRLR